MSVFSEAKDKLNREIKSGSYDKYAEAMKTAVKDALIDLCVQSESFARHVVEGGSFEECMKKVAKGVKGSHISDLAAFDIAVKHYYPKAKVSYSIKIEDPDSKVTETAAPSHAQAEEFFETKPACEILDLGAFL